MRKARSEHLPKSKLIETAADLVYRQGWSATGINQILGEAKVPKGSFYYHFRSKEDLGVAIVRHYHKEYERCFAETLYNNGLPARQAIEKCFTDEIGHMEAVGWRWGCRLGSFSNEIADTAEKIADACRDCFQNWLTAMSEAIKRGQREGNVTSTTSPERLALQVMSIWQGGLLCMKTIKSEAPVKAAYDLIGELLFE